MEINWINVVLTIALVIVGYLAQYLKTKTELVEKAKYAVNGAEKEYESVAKAGGQKMEAAIDYLYQFVPAIVKPFFTREMLRQIVQSAFDGMKAFADKQLDKVVDKIID